MTDSYIGIDGGELESKDYRGALGVAVELQPPPPCVDTGEGHACEYFRRCAVDCLACESFLAYTRAVEIASYKEWHTFPRIPNSQWFSKIYRDSES